MSRNDAEFVDKILQISNAQSLEIDGIQYSTKPLHDPRKPLPVPHALKVAGLDSFAEYVNENKDKLVMPELSIHIESAHKVSLISALYGEFKQRDVYAYAEPVGKSFEFGRAYENENFIVALQTLFVDTPARNELIKLMSSLRDEQDVRTHTDDGVTQVVTAKVGIALQTEVKVPNPVSLIPYRTFREIQQPPSFFVLRLTSNRNSKPSATLHEADGGSWELLAMDGIAAYLSGKIKGVTILA